MVKILSKIEIVERCEVILSEITDPELPFISIKDLGILRKVTGSQEGGAIELHVVITPTFSGCPALFEIKGRILGAVKQFSKNVGVEITCHIDTELSPPWGSQDISAEGRDILIENGIAVEDRGIVCPRCQSENTAIVSEFGSTACKSFSRCLDCREPFEVFKSV